VSGCRRDGRGTIVITPPNKFEGATRRRKLRAWPALPSFAMTEKMASVAGEDRFAIAALRFASCPAFAGMTEGERFFVFTPKY